MFDEHENSDSADARLSALRRRFHARRADFHFATMMTLMTSLFHAAARFTAARPACYLHIVAASSPTRLLPHCATSCRRRSWTGMARRAGPVADAVRCKLMAQQSAPAPQRKRRHDARALPALCASHDSLVSPKLATAEHAPFP